MGNVEVFVSLLHMTVVYEGVLSRPVLKIERADNSLYIHHGRSSFQGKREQFGLWCRDKEFVRTSEISHNHPHMQKTAKSRNIGIAYLLVEKWKADGGNKRRKRSNSLQGPGKWKNTNITWALENSNDDVISEYDLRHVLTEAFNKWESVTNLHFTQLINEPPNTAMIRVRFEIGLHNDPIAFDGRGGVYAHAFFPVLDPIYDKSLPGDVHFDDAETFTIKKVAQKDKIKLSWIALHEIGHSLGLTHSDKKGAIMYAIYHDPGNEDIELTHDDIIRIQNLYGEKKVNTSYVHKSLSTEGPETHIKKLCTNTMKAAFVGNNEKLYFINNNTMYMLHYQSREGIETGPVHVSTYFNGLQRVDSIFRRPNDKSLVIFHGDKFSVYHDKKLKVPPRKISDGFQSFPNIELKNIDAAFIWPENNQLYIFKGELYWRYSQSPINSDYMADFGYPRNIAADWRGLPKTIDTVFQWTNNKMYFTKDDYYYRWDHRHHKVHSGYPIKLTRSFLKCHRSH